MNCRIFLQFLCAAVVLPAVFAANQVGTITSSGAFRLGNAQIPPTAVKSLPLVSGDEVDTTNSTAMILLRDMSRVILDPNSRLKVERKGEDTVLRLERGELRFKTLAGSHLLILSGGRSVRPSAPSEGVVTTADARSSRGFTKALAVQVGAGQVRAAPMLHIVILEGEGAINNIRARTAREPIIQVQDENNRPVSGVAVLFELPGNGPSGTFNGGRSLSVLTDSEGKATGNGLLPNTIIGAFQILVSASYLGQTANAVINQSNELRGGGALIPGATTPTTTSATGSILVRSLPIILISGGVGGTVAALVTGGDAPPLSPSQP